MRRESGKGQIDFEGDKECQEDVGVEDRVLEGRGKGRGR
jgi:hypothetical protein